MSELKDRVKSLREYQGLSQQDLATKMGYSSRSSINKIENGRQVTQKIIVKLADALHTSPAYLMGWTTDTKPMHDERMECIINKLYCLTFSQLNQVERIIDTFIDEP